MSAPLSLIIFARNNEAHVAAAVGSVLRQTRGDFDLVIWDDGSHDRTVDVATEAGRRDPRVRVLRGERRGLSVALNAAAREVSGRYLGWIEGDGALAPLALERAAAVLDANPAVGMVYTQYVTMDDTGRVGGLGRRCHIPYSRERLLVDFMTFHFRLMRRETFDAVGGLDEKLSHAQEYDMCLRLSEVTQVQHVAEPLYFHRVRDLTPSVQDRAKQIYGDRDVIANALERRGLADDYEVDLEIVSRLELRRRARSHGVSAPDRATDVPFAVDWALVSADAANADLDEGLVSCLCVTRGRHDHVRRALECFRAQTYSNRELVVVYEGLDGGAQDLLAQHRADVSLVHVRTIPKQPLGVLRNLSLKGARGVYVCCWDDDDWHSPRRIELQLRHLLSSRADACMLRRWLMFDETTGLAYVSGKRMWEGSLLCRRDLDVLKIGYPPLVRAEDRALVEELAARHRVTSVDRPELYVYTHHGGNTWGREHFLLLAASGLELPRPAAERLGRVLSSDAGVARQST